MAACTGLIVANLYYCQPLIVLIANEFKIPEANAGTITYLTQAGYAIGLFFMVPLGDKIERKKQILMTTLASVIALIIAATAKSFFILQIASLLIGITSIVPQLILPLAASLTSQEQRGKVIGTIMSGLLVGILLSRTLSGFIGQVLGWRSMFWIAAGICLLIFFAIQKKLPVNKPQFSGTYGQLIQSLFTLIKTQPVLREATLINVFCFAQFGAFWTTMVLLLSGAPFNFNSATIGLFGIVGASGALAAPLVGKMGDKGNPRVAVGYGCLLMLISFIIFYFSIESVIGVIIGIVFIDIGIQGVHISNQTRVYSLVPEARNRLNTVFMSFSFLGTAAGSAYGLLLWKIGQWHAVAIGCAVLAILALIVYSVTFKSKSKTIETAN
ncbi:MFS transporter [Flavobacterium sp. Fl-77]|uniref:MFS transporter n=1 Tax=Flavobacterium flavipigmentatum TaxID=2893884 RepID=A0AAJ2VYZ5_9FLAO|nr:MULTISPECIES: MFS transporter [unclassified Flavobacterium]MDX6181955.1 MFS transporter [Flavobacterium sp. Fl-33]MDX6186990.1 MFS transporter [Flavobacterium sp. Fl-77]UFH37125.1 MFS transporter [Flavobacterium sp. F-70]